MRARCICVIGLFMMFTLVFSAHPQEKVYWDVVEKIMEEAFENSHVMENSSWLCDVFGPRNAKSSSFRAAAKWAKKRLEEYGLSNATLDSFEFGTGWENQYTSVHMMSPRYMPIIAYPPMWSAGTKGKVRGPVVYINFDAITSEKDLDQYRGKLKNTIIFTRPKQEMIPHLSTLPEIYTEDELDEMAEIHVGPKVSPKKRNRPHYGDPETQQYKPEHAKFSAYYNMDIGPGKIRGIYIKGNEGVRPIFTEWMKPLKSLGMTHIITEPIGSEDDGFRAVGLPGFHFLQDRKELDDRLAHTNMDVYERLIPEGLMQSSVVMATFVYHTAMRDELLPRIAPIQR